MTEKGPDRARRTGDPRRFLDLGLVTNPFSDLPVDDLTLDLPPPPLLTLVLESSWSVLQIRGPHGIGKTTLMVNVGAHVGAARPPCAWLKLEATQGRLDGAVVRPAPVPGKSGGLAALTSWREARTLMIDEGQRLDAAGRWELRGHLAQHPDRRLVLATHEDLRPLDDPGQQPWMDLELDRVSPAPGFYRRLYEARLALASRRPGPLFPLEDAALHRAVTFAQGRPRRFLLLFYAVFEQLTDVGPLTVRIVEDALPWADVAVADDEATVAETAATQRLWEFPRVK